MDLLLNLVDVWFFWAILGMQVWRTSAVHYDRARCPGFHWIMTGSRIWAIIPSIAGIHIQISSLMTYDAKTDPYNLYHNLYPCFLISFLLCCHVL